jgi:excisionase family DNA binding protein
MTDEPTVTAPDPSVEPVTYTVPEIARLTQSSARHVWRLADRGLIPGRIKGLGRLVRFSKSAIDAWLAGQTGTRRQGAP